ncbi:hypothetical protein H4R27_003942 [Coemansia aciculifera]|nr:hypothetical protein H4R27_003942 [Coemansia aciculifera]
MARDEISVLRELHAALGTAKCKAGKLQRLVCGVTVKVNDTHESTQFVLGAELDSYNRWSKTHGLTGTTHEHRVHRRMVSGPVRIPLHELRSNQEAVTAVASAMLVYVFILVLTGVLHRDISEENSLATRDKDSKILGVLIDFDNTVPRNDERNKENPGHVGTEPFISITDVEGLDMQRTAVDDWESALVLILVLVADGSHRDELCEKLFRVEPGGVVKLRKEIFA